MAEIALIHDLFTCQRWVEKQPCEAGATIAVRAALRTLPHWWAWVMENADTPEHTRSTLPGLRACLISRIATSRPSDAMIRALACTTIDIHLDYNVAHAAASAMQDATHTVAAILSAVFHHTNAEDAVSSAAYVAFAAESVAVYAASSKSAADQIWSEVRADARLLSGGSDAAAAPLWSQDPNPFEARWQEVRTHEAQIENAGTAKSFWITWYQSVLDGKPMLGNVGRTDEMLEKIALIAPEDWDRGEDVVNPQIEEIWELYRLRVEVAALKAERDEIRADSASAEHRSHNHPPELIDATREVAQRTEIIWAALDDAETELEADEPDKSRLRRIARNLLAALRLATAYCGKVADTVIISGAKVGGVAAFDWLFNNGRLWQFVKDLLSFSWGP